MLAPSKPGANGGVRAIARRVVRIALLASLLGVSTLLGLVLHVNTVVGRALVASEVNRAVSGLLVSELRIETIDFLSFERLVVARARLLDRQGRAVMTAEGLEARFDLMAVARGVLGAGAVRVRVPSISVRHFALDLNEDPARRGHFTLERAFEPRTPPSGTGPGVFVELPSLAVRSASVRTNLRGLAGAKADIGALDAGLNVSPAGVVLSLATRDARVAKVLARNIEGKLAGELRLPGATKADFDVRAGSAPLAGTFALENGKLDITARSPALEPAALRELFGSWPLVAPLAASAELAGPPEALNVKAEGRAGRSVVSTTGRLSLAPQVGLALDATARELDLQLFSKDALPTAVDVRGRVEIRLEPVLEVRAWASVPACQVSGFALPPFDAQGTYTEGRLVGSAKVADPRLSAVVDFEVQPSGRVEFAAQARALELGALRRYGIEAHGLASLRTRGALANGQLEASVEATGTAIAIPPVRAARVSLSGRAAGALTQPSGLRIDGAIRGHSLNVAGVPFERFEVKSTGSGAVQRVSLELASAPGVRVRAAANASFGTPVVLEGLAAEARSGDAVTTLVTEHAAFGPGRVVVRGLVLRAGEGSLHGSAELAGRREEVAITAEKLDLAALGASLGLGADFPVSGQVDARVALAEQGDRRRGHATASITGARLPELGVTSGEVALDFNGAAVEVRAALAAEALARATLSAKGTLAGPLAAPAPLARLSGEASLRIEEVELAEVSRRWLEGSGVRIAGKAGAELLLERETLTERPELSYRLRTESLLVTATHEAAGAGRGELATRLDLASQGELFRADGSHLLFTVLDARGPWLEIQAQHAFGAGDLARALEPGAAGSPWDAPFEASVTANRRPVSALGGLGSSGIEGDVTAVAGVSGTLRRPDVSASVELHGLNVPLVGGEAIDLDLDLLYSTARQSYALEARSRSTGEDLIELSATGTLAGADGSTGQGPTARVEARVERLDLGRVGSVIGQPVRGHASGRGSLQLGSGGFNARCELKLADIRVEERALGNGSLRVSVEDGRTEAQFRIADRNSKLEVSADGGLTWNAGGIGRDARVDRHLQLTASNFDVANVGPWLASFATQLSGKLNGHAELSWIAGETPATQLRANATLTDATASLTAGGGLIRGIQISAVGEAGKPLALDFSGAARSRHPNIEGTALVSLDGLALQRLDAKIRVDGFPLVYEGVLLGKATIAREVPPLAVLIEQRASHLHVGTTVPAVVVTLPEASDTTLIALEDDPSVTIVEVTREPDAVTQKREVERGTAISVELGRRVQVVQGELKVPVTGKLALDTRGRLSGALRFPPGGVVPALGHTFRIKDGFVRFEEQAVNDGVVSIQATTRTADATAVELDVSGTVGQPVLRFQSDPPRSEEEIVALLVGLRPEDSAGDQGQQFGGVAWALAMNRLVKGSALSGLQFGAGQTSEGNEVKTISMRVSNKVWLEGRSVRGSETSLNQTDNASGVVDWRFAPSFSLRTQLGTVSGMELRWSHGY